jgi:hypothetical protein
MTQHADLELIAALREGLLDGPEAERLSHHLALCGICAEREAAISRVTMRLAAAPAPTMPSGVARRLDAALDAEIAATRGATPAAAHGTTRPAGGRERHGAHERRAAPRRQGRSPSRLRWPVRSRGWVATAVRPLAAAAAAFLIVGGGYLLIHSSHSTSSSSSALGSASPSRHAQAGPAPATTNGGGSSRLAAPAVYTVHRVTAYRSGQLPAQAAAALQKYGSHLLPQAKAGSITMQPFGTLPLSGCVRRVAPRERRLLVFDNARYDGHPAKVIIAPGASGQPGYVWVVSPDCSASTGRLIAKHSLP